MFYFVGPDYDQLKAEYFDRLIGHFPSGASATMFLHFIQNVLSKEFRELDFGPAINIQKYGKLYPPLYNLTRVTAPVYLYYSLNDFLSHNLVSKNYYTKTHKNFLYNICDFELF